MDSLIAGLPEIIRAAAQSHLGILALLSVALAVLAYFFFAKSAVKIRVWIFVLLFLGVVGFAVAMFRVAEPAGGSHPPAAQNAALSEQGRLILSTAAQDPAGLVLFERFGASVDLHSNGISLFTDKGDHKELVSWEAALDELVEQGFMVERGDRGEVFEITRLGYDAAEKILESE
jgi:hypothetical protein